MIENFYNLVDEKWIPIEGRDKASLRDVFSPSFLGLVSGNAIQKISIYKLLFAIAQDAISIENERAWKELGLNNFSSVCLDYLDKYHDCFYLYGEKPFLQYPELAEKDQVITRKIFCSYIPDIAAENDTIIYQTQNMPPKDDGEKALFVLTLMSYSLGGKRTSKPELFIENSDIRKATSIASPSLGKGNGYQQSFFLCSTIPSSIYNNFFTEKELSETTYNKNGVVAPWRKMPTLESSEYNNQYKNSIFAWFVSMTRAVLLIDDGIKYCEELVYDSNDWFDPFITKKEGKTIIVDTNKKPWRSIQAMMAEVNTVTEEKSVRCFAIDSHMNRLRENTDFFSIWAGGLRVRSNSGDQSVKQSDDYVESTMSFYSSYLGEIFYNNMRLLLKIIDDYEKRLKRSIFYYYKNLGYENYKSDNITNTFWQKMNDISQDFVESSESEEEVNNMSERVFLIIRDIYDRECQKESSRQIFEWINNRPKRRKINGQ